MTLKEFKDYIESFPKEKEFEFSISKPFSWRGSYNEVAFRIIELRSSREAVLESIQRAFTEVFEGYKGGEYRFSDGTPVNFEDSISDYTDGAYTSRWIAMIEGQEETFSQEERLVKLAFQ